jgi:hypothetical protein
MGGSERRALKGGEKSRGGVRKKRERERKSAEVVKTGRASVSLVRFACIASCFVLHSTLPPKVRKEITHRLPSQSTGQPLVTLHHALLPGVEGMPRRLLSACDRSVLPTTTRGGREKGAHLSLVGDPPRGGETGTGDGEHDGQETCIVARTKSVSRVEERERGRRRGERTEGDEGFKGDRLRWEWDERVSKRLCYSLRGSQTDHGVEESCC